jgi:hypothetical protein
MGARGTSMLRGMSRGKSGRQQVLPLETRAHNRREGAMKEWIMVFKAADAAARWHVDQRRKGAAKEPYIMAENLFASAFSVSAVSTCAVRFAALIQMDASAAYGIYFAARFPWAILLSMNCACNVARSRCRSLTARIPCTLHASAARAACTGAAGGRSARLTNLRSPNPS